MNQIDPAHTHLVNKAISALQRAEDDIAAGILNRDDIPTAETFKAEDGDVYVDRGDLVGIAHGEWIDRETTSYAPAIIAYRRDDGTVQIEELD